MSYGKMNTDIDIVSTEPIKDFEGFSTKGDTVLASVKAFKQERDGSETWINRAAFSNATALFRFRKIPSLDITTALSVVCADGRYNIVSVEKQSGRGLYIEVLAKKEEASNV